MDARVRELLDGLTGGAPVSAQALHELEVLFHGFRQWLPNDLRGFLLEMDGAEGFVRRNYLVLWGAAQIVACHTSYQVETFAPGLVLFGSDGGGGGYAFDLRDPRPGRTPVVQLPLMGMDLKDLAPQAPTFTAFLEKLAA